MTKRPMARARWLGLAMLAATSALADISGQVVDPADMPVTGATVHLVIPSDRNEDELKVAASVTSDAKGRYGFAPAQDRQSSLRWVLVEAPGWALRMVNVPAQQAHVELPVTLAPGTDLDVPVRDDDGQPLAGVALRVARMQPEPEGRNVAPAELLGADMLPAEGIGRLTATTDAQGVAHFHGLPRRTRIAFEATGPTYARLGREGTRATTDGAATVADPLVLVPGATISGRVVDQQTGRPEVRANVYWQSQSGSASAVTDADGRYRLERVRPSPGRLEATPWSADDRLAAPKGLRLEPGELSGQDFTLVKGVELVVHVDAPAGRPAAGVEVSAWGGVRVRSRTGADGDARLTVLPGKLSVTIFGRASQLAPEQTVEVAAGKPNRLAFVLAEAWGPDPTLTVRVLKPDGSPAAGATVDGVQTSPGAQLRTGGTTGVDGRCEVPLQSQDAVEVRARLGRLFTGPWQTVHVGGEVVLRLVDAPAARLEVTVQDEHGQPRPGATVRLLQGEPYPFEFAHGVTDPQGRIVFADLPPVAGYHVTARAAGYGNATADLTLPPGATLAVPPLRLPPADQELVGWVLDAAGKPMPGVYVQATDATGSNQNLMTDAKGEFRCKGLVKGRVRLMVRTPKQGTDLEVEAGRDDVVVRLK